MTQSAAKRLHESLGLGLPPIAVSLTDTVPAGVPSVTEAAAAGCAFWERAAKGPFFTSAADHALCSIGIHTHNLSGAPPSQASELKLTLKVLNDLDYVRDEEVAAIPVLQRSVKHVVYAPLSDAPIAPDVVVLFAHARHSLVITEAVQQVEAGLPPAMGRPACAMIPQVANSGRAAMSLGCCGARAYLDALTDETALWALPGASINAYADRIVALASANATLAKFHGLRREAVAQGVRPTVEQSLAALSS
jgi:uncharacterized protein (DUF169 family)